MAETYQELGFDALVTIGSGIVLATYMLGIILDPLPASAVGFGLVSFGVVALVPRRARTTATSIGFLAVGLAGVLIPRAVTSFIALPPGNELEVTLVGSGLVLLLTFPLLRMTVFHNRGGKPAQAFGPTGAF